MIKGREDAEAYADMPQKLIDYIKALPEYNAKIFKAITGRESQWRWRTYHYLAG